MPVLFSLTSSEVAELQRPINGQGGFQTLFRALQARLQANGDIVLTDAQLGAIVRHIGFRPGGFETRIDTIFGRSVRAMLI